jgi:hypothetical protein
MDLKQDKSATIFEWLFFDIIEQIKFNFCKAQFPIWGGERSLTSATESLLTSFGFGAFVVMMLTLFVSKRENKEHN